MVQLIGLSLDDYININSGMKLKGISNPFTYGLWPSMAAYGPKSREILGAYTPSPCPRYNPIQNALFCTEPSHRGIVFQRSKLCKKKGNLLLKHTKPKRALSVAFVRDSGHIISAGGDNFLQIWDTSDECFVFQCISSNLNAIRWVFVSAFFLKKVHL